MRTILLLVPVFVAGCASTVDCGSDWFAVGQNEGRMNALNQSERYAAKCPGMDAARYDEGYRDGFSRRPIPLW